MKLLTLCLIATFYSMTAFAQFEEGTYELIIKKQQNKEDTRWSFAEWYETKNKMRLQDMWLALNSSDNPFEFFVGYEKSTYKNIEVVNNGAPTELSHSREVYSFDAFASIAGLQYKTWSTSEDTSGWSADFKLRILGTSNQNTNLTLTYGTIYSEDNSASNLKNYRNETYGASLTFYITKYFGFLSEYTKINAKANSQGTEVSGSSYSYEAFIDYGLVRVFGGQKSEKKSFVGVNTTEVDDTTSHFGVKVFF